MAVTEKLLEKTLDLAGAAISANIDTKNVYQAEINRHEAPISAERKQKVYDQLSRILHKLQNDRTLSIDKKTFQSLSELKVLVHRFTSKKTTRIYEELLRLMEERMAECEQRREEAEESCSELRPIFDRKTGEIVHEDYGILSEAAELHYQDLYKSIKDDCSLSVEEIDKFIARLGNAEKNDH